jgi:hypothetical protein
MARAAVFFDLCNDGNVVAVTKSSLRSEGSVRAEVLEAMETVEHEAIKRFCLAYFPEGNVLNLDQFNGYDPFGLWTHSEEGEVLACIALVSYGRGSRKSQADIQEIMILEDFLKEKRVFKFLFEEIVCRAACRGITLLRASAKPEGEMDSIFKFLGFELISQAVGQDGENVYRCRF